MALNRHSAPNRHSTPDGKHSALATGGSQNTTSFPTHGMPLTDGGLYQLQLEEMRCFRPTHEQQAIIDAFRCSTDSFLIEALAGSGKTTILRYLTYLFRQDTRNDNNSVIYLAFAKEFAVSASLKFAFGGRTSVMTTHQFGYQVIRRNEPGVTHKVTADSESRVLKVAEKLGFNKPWDKARLKTLASWVRNGICDGTAESIRATADVFGSLAFSDRTIRSYVTDRCFSAFLRSCLRRNEPVIGSIADYSSLVDFDDMLRPDEEYSLGISPGDLVLVDEFQDMNPAQLALVNRIISAGARVVAVGDPHQSIFAFRTGVLYNPLAVIAKEHGLSIYPMTISQRSPVVGARLAARIVPSFKHKDNAIDGNVWILDDTSPSALLTYYETLSADGKVSPENPLFVIARANSTLITRAMHFLLNKVRFYYRVDCMAKLNSILYELEELDKTGCTSIHTLLNNWYLDTIAKVSPNRLNTISYYGELYKCLQELIDHKRPVLPALKEALRSLSTYSASKGEASIEFHTVHSAKGLETDHVFLAQSASFPHPMATQPWEKIQEMNILYVAVTRFKQSLLLDHFNFALGELPLYSTDDSEQAHLEEQPEEAA